MWPKKSKQLNGANECFGFWTVLKLWTRKLENYFWNSKWTTISIKIQILLNSWLERILHCKIRLKIQLQADGKSLIFSSYFLPLAKFWIWNIWNNAVNQTPSFLKIGSFTNLNILNSNPCSKLTYGGSWFFLLLFFAWYHL